MAEHEEVTLVEGPGKKKKKKSKLLVVVLALVVLSAVAGGAVYAMRRGGSGRAPSNPGLIAFDPFVVNLADPGGLRFLRVTLQVEVDDAKEASNIAEDQVATKRARSVILELLSQQTAASLVTTDGKAALKKAILDRVAPIFPTTKVIDVLFSEFVVQF